MNCRRALLLAGLCATGAGAQTIYRCTDATGKPVYQHHACATTGSAVDLPPPNILPSQQKSDLARAAALRRSSNVDQAIARGEIVDGMTDVELRQALGEPLVVNSDRQAGKGVRQKWVYRYPNGDSRTVLLRDGVVTGEQLRPNERATGKRCPSAREIDNERVSASSTTLTAEQRKTAQLRIERMESCGKWKAKAG